MAGFEPPFPGNGHMRHTIGSTVLMREVPGSLTHCALEFQSHTEIDTHRARAQQQAYSMVLEQLGKKILWVDKDEAYPDCCYIEDTAVVVNDTAVVTQPGSASRRGETAAIRRRLLELGFRIVDMRGGAFLEGGDVLRIEERMFVGNSERTTNSAGIDVLCDAMERHGVSVLAVPVQRALHLKTACTYIGNGVLVAVPECLPGLSEWAAGLRLIALRPEELPAANMLAVDNVIMMSAGWPRVRDLVERAGFEVVEVDISEHHKAEAGLTCLSVLL